MWAKDTEAVKQTTIFCVYFLFVKATHLSLERVAPQLRTGMLWWGNGKIQIETLYPDVWIEIFYFNPGKETFIDSEDNDTVIHQAIMVNNKQTPETSSELFQSVRKACGFACSIARHVGYGLGGLLGCVLLQPSSKG